MNTETGNLINYEELSTLPEMEQNKYITVNRDLTLKEKADNQIRLYAPCGCGSGKKFKFCCKSKNS